jgi:hypothetical protein
MKIVTRFENASLMKTLGADPSALYSSEQEFDTDTAFKSFKPKLRLSKSRSVSSEKQRDQFDDLLINGLHGNPLIVISSMPSDALAKLLALNLFESILNTRRDNLLSSLALSNKTAPRWHTMYNKFLEFDRLRSENPCALFVSNVNCATGPKLERIRDLLEFYSSIPRIVVMGGEDPVGFIVNQLYLPVTMAFCAGGPRSHIPTLVEAASV